MRHSRSDYDGIQPIPGEYTGSPIPDDEPVFLLRGQDPAAAATVRAYAKYAVTEGADGPMVDAIVAWADEMQACAMKVQHGAPDVPEGMLRP